MDICALGKIEQDYLRRILLRERDEQFTADDMRGWYAHRDVLGYDDELILPGTTSLDEANLRIAAAAGLPQDGRDDAPQAG